mmetsp:Transcript_59980/g.103315  ORF Transcript_59980/g.103315 Transcript_59980/m.103315 type:complete len:92 (+) Transcript_59980:335-610(+)
MRRCGGRKKSAGREKTRQVTISRAQLKICSHPDCPLSISSSLSSGLRIITTIKSKGMKAVEVVMSAIIIEEMWIQMAAMDIMTMKTTRVWR